MVRASIYEFGEHTIQPITMITVMMMVMMVL